MAGARPLDTLRLTTGIAIGTLLLTGAILLGPAIRDCSDGQGSLSICLRDKLVDRQLLPDPELPMLDAAAPDSSLAPPPSAEILLQPGILAAIPAGSGTNPAVAVDLAATGTIEVATTTVSADPVAGTELVTTGGGLSVSLPTLAPVAATARLNAAIGTVAATPAQLADLGTSTGSLQAPVGTITPPIAAAGVDPIITATLTGPTVALTSTAPVLPVVPAVRAPFTEVPGALAASASTSESDGTAFANLIPLDVPEPPPLPRPRDDDPPVVDDPPPIPDPTPLPEPEPVPPVVPDDPEFPSVTVLPPPLTGENSSIITLTLDF